MKKLFTILLLTVLVVSSAYSQSLKNAKPIKASNISLFQQNFNNPNNNFIPSLKMPMHQMVGLKNEKYLDNEILAATKICSTYTRYTYLDNTTPFVYEPISGTLMFVNVTPETATSTVYLEYSTNNGTKWTKKVIESSTDYSFYWPSLAVLNPTSATTPTSLDILTYSPYLSVSANTWAGGFFVRANGTSDLLPFYFANPSNNSQQNWWTAQMTSAVNGSVYAMHTIGMLNSAASQTTDPDFSQQGCYGVASFNQKIDGFINGDGGMIPPQLDLDQFLTPESTGYYNSPISTDVDSKGNVYVAVCNIFASSTDSVRLPGVAKSTDNGATWSSFDILPTSLIDDIVSQTSMTGGYFIPPYEYLGKGASGFIVTGEDEFSMLEKMILYNSDENTFIAYIMEVYKKDGSWGLRPITTFNSPIGTTYSGNMVKVTDNYSIGYGPLTLQYASLDQWTTHFLLLVPNPNGSELSLSRTADGTTILAKWLDFTGDFIQFGSTYTLYTQSDQSSSVDLDSLPQTDIFVASRNLANDTWDSVYNVTATPTFSEKGTIIPRVIPSLAKIPLLYNSTYSIYSDLTSAPVILQQMVTSTANYVYFNSVNITGGTPVKEQTNTYNFTLKDAYPNPVDNKAEIGFTLEKTSNVTLEVYSSLGQKVATILNGSLQSSGPHANNFNTQNLTNGVYYYTIIVDGNTATKKLVVNHK